MDAAAARGELQGRAPLLRDAWKAWLVGAERGTILARGDKRYRPSTLRGYRQAMSMADGLMSVPLDKITRRLLAEHVQGLMERGLASQSVRNMMLPLRAVFRHAIDMEVVVQNPTRGLRMPAGSGYRIRALEPAAIPQVLDAVPDRDRPVWATAIYAGLRRGELMALRWSDVDLGAGVITVRLSYDHPSRTMGLVKSRAGQDRRVPMVPQLRDYLMEHRLRAGARTGGLVFARGSLASVATVSVGEPDAPFADRGLTRRASRAWFAAGIRPVTLHDCRHTFASLMIHAMAAAGTFNPKMVQQMLGHASIQQTYDRYGHLFPGAEAEAVRMLGAFLDASSALPSVADSSEGVRERPVSVQRMTDMDGEGWGQ